MPSKPQPSASIEAPTGKPADFASGAAIIEQTGMIKGKNAFHSAVLFVIKTKIVSVKGISVEKIP